MNANEIQSLDSQFVWHPTSQMKDYESYKPLVINSASGSYIELDDGKKIIDAISSWWCKSLGHNHPLLKAALKDQLERFEHVILANTTNERIVKLSRQLVELMPHLGKVFYAGDGCCSVEIALKMSLHTRVIQEDHKRNKFIALKNGYHGETAGALSVSDVGLFRNPYSSILFEPFFIDVPYVSNINDPIWSDATDHWYMVEKLLEPYCDTASAIIFEPIVQGAGGIKIYSQDFLAKLANWAKQHNIHIIADEIMTGLGRTGKMLACEHANIEPDFVCLSKGLTSGWMAFSAVMTTNDIYQTFYADYETGKAFLHSHTYSGNALAASVASATIDVIKNEQLCSRANELQEIMMANLQEIAAQTGKLNNLRGLGAVVAADLSPNNKDPRLAYHICCKASSLGALLRPIGNTIYWIPPLNITDQTLEELKFITMKAINSI